MQTLVKLNGALGCKKVMGANKDEGAILKAFDEKTGEVVGQTAFFREKTVDQEQFTKFYLSGFKAFFDLRPATIKVFGYILNLLKPNSDEFLFNYKDCMEVTKYSSVTIFKALAELCKAEIIARGWNDVLYYINPMVVFNGDRVTFATTYINKNFPNRNTSNARLKNTIGILEDDGELPRDDVREIPLFGDNEE